MRYHPKILAGTVIERDPILYHLFDELVKSHGVPFTVIPVEAGIQYFRAVAKQVIGVKSRSLTIKS
jgi:hypothetical protein